MSTLAIITTLFLLMFFAYRGYSVLILAPIMAMLAVVLSGDFLNTIPAYTDVFMSALGGFLIKFFPIFLLGAIFGRLMADSGATAAIARTGVGKLGANKAILAVILVCAILTYGGVSLFVGAFALYPIAKDLFKVADVPKRLIPAAIALGSFTFTMTALPGTPAIQNAIPIPYYNTNVFAAPMLGIIGGMIMFIGGWLWLQSRATKANAAGGLDSLPHSGAVITVFAICGLTHKESYVNLAMVTMAIPIVATVAVMILGTMFGSF